MKRFPVVILLPLFGLISISMLLWPVDIKDLEKQLDSAKGAEKIRILFAITELLVKNDPHKALTYGEKALLLLKTHKDKKKELGVLDQLCQAYRRLGDYTNAGNYSQKCLDLAQKIGDKQAQGRALNNLTIISIQKGEFEKSREYANRVYDTFKKLGDKLWMGISLNNIGISYDMQGKYEKALEYYLKSLEIREEIGDKAMIGSSLNNIGVIQNYLHNSEKALEYYSKALEIKKELNDQPGIANLYSNMGNIYLEMKDNKKALELYQESLKIDRKLENPSGIASTLFNIGLVYFNTRDYGRALNYYNQSLSTREKMGEKQKIAMTSIEIGKVQQQLNQPTEAIKSIERGLTIAREIGAQEEIQDSLKTLSSIYEDTRDYRSALFYYKDYKNTAEKILDNDSKKKIAEIQAKYDATKKEKEILLLKNKNEIQKIKLSRQKLLRNLLIAGFIILSIGLIQLVRKYRYVFAFWKKKNYIGHYKIIKQVASGGMGTVYKAADVIGSHGQTLAIKVMRDEYFDDEIKKKRFKQEASIIDQLVHPNIVRVIERGESDGNMYIAMELLEGPTLAEMIKKEKKIPVVTAMEIMTQISDALKSIHSMNIIHRDLKPENIVLVSKENNPYFVKLLDFGLATSQNMSRLTETGMMIGTIYYLTPELIAGGRITPASDVFALGIIFYEMLTGSKPFMGDSNLEVMKQILNKEPIPIDLFQPARDRAISDLVMFMLKKDPSARPDMETIFNILIHMKGSL